MDDPGVAELHKDAAVAGIAGAPRSLVDRIRARHEGKVPTLDLPVPRWGGDVIVRYKRLAPSALTAATRQKRAALQNATLLVAACEEVFLVNDETGELEPARDADGNPAPIRFDGRLADLFALKGSTPVEIAVSMFGDSLALGAQAKRLFDWQTGADIDDLPDEEVDEAAGEGDAAT